MAILEAFLESDVDSNIGHHCLQWLCCMDNRKKPLSGTQGSLAAPNGNHAVLGFHYSILLAW